MKLYLSTEKTKNGLSYTPDWIRLEYKQEPNLTLDIQADIDYEKGLNCRCKGEIIPWVLFDSIEDEEIDLISKYGNELDKMYPASRIIEMIKTADEIVIGVVPAHMEDDDSIYEIEQLKGEAKLYIANECLEFNFSIEINY